MTLINIKKKEKKKKKKLKKKKKTKKKKKSFKINTGSFHTQFWLGEYAYWEMDSQFPHVYRD
jgi:hypothetical protein